MTPPTAGGPPPGRSSSATERAPSVTWTRAAGLLVAGGAAVALHAATRHHHLHLPGHQGLVWMTLLAFARAATGMTWAASLAGLGAAAAAAVPVLGFNDPLSVAGYLAPALVFDVLSNRAPAWRRPSLRAGALGAVALATKALLQTLATLTLGWQTAVATHGLPYTLSLHVAFGFAGGFLGVWLWRRAL